MNLKVMVAFHKPFPLASADPVYLPIQAGRALHAPIPGLIGDDTGDNISAKNPNYCELTALYWGWKNLNADFVGLIHYRRFFARHLPAGPADRILRGKELAERLARVPVLLPSPRRYFIETNRSHYIHAHHREDLETVQSVIRDLYPEYSASFHRVMNRTGGHRFNMFIMRRDILDGYCRWLFGILFETEKRLDISGYSPYDARVFGFIAERLLDVYFEHEKIPYRNGPTIHLESQHWDRKIYHFLRRKFFGGSGRGPGASARPNRKASPRR